MFSRHATLSGHTKSPHAISVSADGRLLVSTSEDLTVRVWDTATWSIKHVINDMDPDTRQAIDVFDISPCGRFLATGVPDFTTKVYSLDTGERIQRLHPVKKDFFNVAEQIQFQPQGDLLACAKGKNIDLFRAAEFLPAGQLKGHTSKAHLVAFTPDGQTLVTCGGKYVKLWDMSNLTERTTLTRHTKMLGSLAVAPNGEFFATGDEGGKIYLWTLPDAKERGEYLGHTKQVFDLAISTDGQTIASWDMNNELHLWNTSTGKQIAKLEKLWGHSHFLPGRNLCIFFGENAETLVINPTNGEVIERLPGSRDGAVAPDGSWFASFEGSDIMVWK